MPTRANFPEKRTVNTVKSTNVPPSPSTIKHHTHHKKRDKSAEARRVETSCTCRSFSVPKTADSSERRLSCRWFPRRGGASLMVLANSHVLHFFKVATRSRFGLGALGQGQHRRNWSLALPGFKYFTRKIFNCIQPFLFQSKTNVIMNDANANTANVIYAQAPKQTQYKQRNKTPTIS